MLYTRNPAGYEFIWPDGSDFVEVYHSDADYSDIPLIVIWAGDIRRNESELRKLANESPDFGRPYNA